MKPKEKLARLVANKLDEEQKETMINKFTEKYKDHPDFENLLQSLKNTLDQKYD